MGNGKMGKVWLVGAGPSDPGLFTLKGKEVLGQAEVVVYDALAGPGVLSMIPGKAERIDVGKRSGFHTMSQEKINELLAEKAREGKRVVRLKGGDPFLFGRGGEELELLAREGIPYEVVPGVTSAFAVPAYQGIPVTHRDYCSSVHIITGHRRQGQVPDVDFEALVRTKGTLVFLMGVAALGEICGGLVEAGMDPDEPAALLMQGTTAAQRRVVATVATLDEAVRQSGAKTPAVLVVGGVCRLADELSWYEKQPLGGVKVLLTRPRELAGETARKLCARGAEVVELPSIRTDRIEGNEALDAALRSLADYQWLVFTSPTGVRVFFEELADRRVDCRRLCQIRFAVIGRGTGKELEKRGYYADLMPEVFDGEHLGRALAQACAGHERVLILRAESGNRELVEALREKRIQADDIATYRTSYEAGGFSDRRGELLDGEISYVLFTSASSVRGFASALGEMDYSAVRAVCIGKQTKAAADALGMQTWMSGEATTDSMIRRLEELVQKEREEDIGRRE